MTDWRDKFLNKVVCGDCLELMRELPDGCVDLVFADPPFNVGKKYGAYRDDRVDYRDWCAEWVFECFRLLSGPGSFYLMTITRHLEWLMPLMAGHGMFINLITWRNVSACHSKRQFWGEYQPILFYGKTTDYIFNTYAEIIPDGQRRWGGYSTEYKGQFKDRWDDIPFVYAGSISHPEAVIMPGSSRKAHPAQMPVNLAKRAIRFSSNEGGVILDPFLGSGTTAVAAAELDRNFIGMELNPDYVEIARRRLLKIQKELPL